MAQATGRMSLDDAVKRWSFAMDAFRGEGGFLDGGYIDKYPRESNEKYEARQKVAYYTNLFSNKINRYIGYLFKDSPVRSSDNEMIRMIFDDADGGRNDIDVFMSSFAKGAKVRGVGLLLVDMPKEVPGTLQEQMEQRAVPYFVSIPPEQVVSFRSDQFGALQSISYHDTMEMVNDDGELEEMPIVRYYDTEGWAVMDEEGTVLESGEHGLGVCPVVAFGENGQFPDVGEFTQISYLAKRHYNLKSELDEILRGQTFSILAIQADQPSDVELKLSTDNAIIYGREMHAPSFLAPDPGPANTYQEEIDRIEASIDVIAYDVTTTRSVESGIALDIKFQGLNGSLSNFAMRLEDLEARAFEIACKYLGIQDDVSISYPKNFSIVDVEREVAILQSVKDLGYTIPTYERLKLEQIVKSDLESVEIEDMEQINTEIEDALKEEPMVTPPADNPLPEPPDTSVV